LIYFMCVLVWTAFIIKTKDHRANTKRKTLMQATWGEPFDPATQIVEDMNVSQTLKFIAKHNA